MSQTTLNQPAAPAAPSKIDHTHKLLSIVSTSLGICGAMGTVIVGLLMNFYVGDVEIQPDKPVSALVVKVYDNKGHEAVYHTAKFQLMPGDYSVEILPEGVSKPLHAQAHVEFRKRQTIA